MQLEVPERVDFSIEPKELGKLCFMPLACFAGLLLCAQKRSGEMAAKPLLIESIELLMMLALQWHETCPTD